MKPAADRLKERAGFVSIAAPRHPGRQQHRRGVADPTRIRDALFRQAFGPVRWVEVVRAAGARGLGARGRMRAGQGAGRHGQAHRCRRGRRVPCSTRRRWPKEGQLS
jgi:malonyl CoA-acyl carrier protein transacylase